MKQIAKLSLKRNQSTKNLVHTNGKSLHLNECPTTGIILDCSVCHHIIHCKVKMTTMMELIERPIPELYY